MSYILAVIGIVLAYIVISLVAKLRHHIDEHERLQDELSVVKAELESYKRL